MSVDTMPMNGTVVKVTRFDTWAKRFAEALRSSNHVQFAAGDLWAEGKSAYGDRSEVVEMLRQFDYTTGTLDNYATVAGKFPQDMRRDGLKFGMFVILAPLAERSDIAEILDRAAADHWSIPTARLVLKAVKSGLSLDAAMASLSQALPAGESGEGSGDGETGEGTPALAAKPALSADEILAALATLDVADVTRIAAAAKKIVTQAI